MMAFRNRAADKARRAASGGDGPPAGQDPQIPGEPAAENVWAGGYELDLVVRRGGRLVFCEVKAKLGERYGDPAEMVGREKRRRLRRAAEAWLARHPELVGLEIRFDVVAVTPRKVTRVVADL